MNNYDFALDTSKIENIITDLEAEKKNMSDAIANIYKIIDEMQDNWEGETYVTAKNNIENYHNGLNSSVVLVEKIISLLNSNETNAQTAINKIKKITNTKE